MLLSIIDVVTWTSNISMLLVYATPHCNQPKLGFLKYSGIIFLLLQQIPSSFLSFHDTVQRVFSTCSPRFSNRQYFKSV